MTMMNFPKFKTLKERYEELILFKLFPDRKIHFIREELTENEKRILDIGYELFQDKLEDMKVLQDEITRISVELANLKSSMDNNDYEYDDNKE